MRTYTWGFDGGPNFKVEVPDDSELAAASTQYEDLIHPSGSTLHRKVLTVKLYFIDAEDIEPESGRTALTLIGEGS